MNIDNKTTALVVTDPQQDFLSEEGVAWGLFVVVRTAVVTGSEAKRMTVSRQATGVFQNHHQFTTECSQP